MRIVATDRIDRLRLSIRPEIIGGCFIDAVHVYMYITLNNDNNINDNYLNDY